METCQSQLTRLECDADAASILGRMRRLPPLVRREQRGAALGAAVLHQFGRLEQIPVGQQAPPAA